MDHGPRIAQVAQLVGDPARANMLARLMDGGALTAKELAGVAGVSPQTTSGHLAKLHGTGLLSLERQGRHRYFRLASPEIARLLEAIMVVAPGTAAPKSGAEVDGRRGTDKLREARTCYDHLAGRVAVAVADALAERGCLDLAADGGDVTPEGFRFFETAGIALPSASRRRAYCRPCLDWSERRPHIAGAVGAAILSHALDRGWVRRLAGSRALDLTPFGRKAFADTFGVRLDG